MPHADLLPPGTSAVPAPPNPTVHRGTATCAAGREALWREHAEEGTPVACEVCGAEVRDTQLVSSLNAPFFHAIVSMIALHLTVVTSTSAQ